MFVFMSLPDEDANKIESVRPSAVGSRRYKASSPIRQDCCYLPFNQARRAEMPRKKPQEYAAYLKLARDLAAGEAVGFADPPAPGGTGAGGGWWMDRFMRDVETDLLDIWKEAKERTWLPNPLRVLRAMRAAHDARYVQPEIKIEFARHGKVLIEDVVVDEEDAWETVLSRWRPAPGDVRLLIPLTMTVQELVNTLDFYQENYGIKDTSHSRKTPEHLLTVVPYLILYHHELKQNFSFRKCAQTFLGRSDQSGKKEAERMAAAAKSFIERTFPP